MLEAVFRARKSSLALNKYSYSAVEQGSGASDGAIGEFGMVTLSTVTVMGGHSPTLAKSIAAVSSRQAIVRKAGRRGNC